MLRVKKYRILGCPCVPIDSIESANKLLTAAVNAKAYGYSVAINAEKIMLYRRDSQMCEAMEQSSLPFSDGAGAVLALKWLHGKRSLKLDLPKTALNLANEKKWSLFVLGSREEVNSVAFEKIKNLYPDIQLVGRLNGYESKGAMVDSIRRASPQLVLAALGSPKQELISYKLKEMQFPTFMIGCGGALDVLAGRAKRAPKFMIDNKLEWVYRLCKQPWRLKRQLKIFKFLVDLIIEKIRYQNQNSFRLMACRNKEAPSEKKGQRV